MLNFTLEHLNHTKNRITITLVQIGTNCFVDFCVSIIHLKKVCCVKNLSIFVFFFLNLCVSHNAAFINFIHLICCTCHVCDDAKNFLSNLLRGLSALQQHLSPPQIWLSISCRVFDGYLLSMLESDTLFHSRTPLCVGNVSSLTKYYRSGTLASFPDWD